ncbi:MAG TPA: phosphatase PAP2 family protein [Candidatus Nanoarchaeia archaeon]|nr:phosphatase PAP2 family protein [Candidatus Nanoarchaeia archaeon]
MNLLSLEISIVNLIQSFQHSWLTSIFIFISLISSTKSYFIIVPIGAAFFYFKHYRLEALFTILASLGNVFNPIIKTIVGRERPTNDIASILETKADSSFPSGHAMGVIIFYGFLLYLTWKLPFKHKKLISTILIFFIILVGISRVYLGVHWPTDVLGAYIIGLLWLILVITIYQKIRNTHKANS